MLAKQAELFVAACEAAVAYDLAIQACADDPNKMSSHCTAEGESLDMLYSNWIDRSKAALKTWRSGGFNA